MLALIVTEMKDIEPVSYDWGAVKWVANNLLVAAITLRADGDPARSRTEFRAGSPVHTYGLGKP